MVSRKWIKKFIKLSLPSLLVYAVFYLFFYKTYPGSEISHIYLSGLKAMTNYEEFFVNALSKSSLIFFGKNSCMLCTAGPNFLDIFTP